MRDQARAGNWPLQGLPAQNVHFTAYWQQIPTKHLWALGAPFNTQHTHILGQIAAVFTDQLENEHSGGSRTQSSLAVSQSPCCHSHQAAPHPLLCLPGGRAQLPASHNGHSYAQEGGTNHQQLDFHSTESNTPRKWNLTVQNAWEHSVSKVLNMGASFPPKNGLNISRNYHRSPNSLLFFFPASGLLYNSWRIFWPFQKCTQDTKIVLNRFTQTGLLNAQEKGTD